MENNDPGLTPEDGPRVTDAPPPREQAQDDGTFGITPVDGPHRPEEQSEEVSSDEVESEEELSDQE